MALTPPVAMAVVGAVVLEAADAKATVAAAAAAVVVAGNLWLCGCSIAAGEVPLAPLLCEWAAPGTLDPDCGEADAVMGTPTSVVVVVVVVLVATEAVAATVADAPKRLSYSCTMNQATW